MWLVTAILIIFFRINWPNLLHAVKIIKATKGGRTNWKVGVQIICERSEQKKIGLLYACSAMCQCGSWRGCAWRECCLLSSCYFHCACVALRAVLWRVSGLKVEVVFVLLKLLLLLITSDTSDVISRWSSSSCKVLVVTEMSDETHPRIL